MKTISSAIRLHIPAGQAAPKPPLASVLAQRGVNIGLFCKDFNAQTANAGLGTPLVVDVTIFSDKTYKFTAGAPTMTHLIKNALGIKSGAKDKRSGFVGKLTNEHIEKIIDAKMSGTNSYTREGVLNMIAGTAKSMGVEIG